LSFLRGDVLKMFRFVFAWCRALCENYQYEAKRFMGLYLLVVYLVKDTMFAKVLRAYCCRTEMINQFISSRLIEFIFIGLSLESLGSVS